LFMRKTVFPQLSFDVRKPVSSLRRQTRRRGVSRVHTWQASTRPKAFTINLAVTVS
jgi:hypothetical protein